MITEQQVRDWMKENPRLAGTIILEFQMGSAIGNLRLLGQTKEQIQFNIDSAFAVPIEPL
jgi:hypothetical protein